MLLTSTTGLVILALVLVAGWLLGLASSSGGKKWKARYLAERDAHAAERDAHAAYRKDADARVADSVRRHADLESRHSELERDRTRAQPVAATAPVADTRHTESRAIPPRSSTVISPSRPQATTAAQPAYPAGERRGWFDWRDSPRR